MPVLLPFRAFRLAVPAGELHRMVYVPGKETPRGFGVHAPVQDPDAALFIYHQRFRFPGDTQESTRVGIMGVLSDRATVLTHEETCPDRVASCAETMKRFDTDPGSLWLWCGDQEGTLGKLLHPEADPSLDVTDRFECRHRIWKASGADRIRSIQQALAGSPLYLADGHHRFAAGWRLATIQVRSPALRMRLGSRPVPDIDTIERNARAGVLLPPKSTDFYPKLAAGLIVHRH